MYMYFKKSIYYSTIFFSKYVSLNNTKLYLIVVEPNILACTALINWENHWVTVIDVLLYIKNIKVENYDIKWTFFP